MKIACLNASFDVLRFRLIIWFCFDLMNWCLLWLDYGFILLFDIMLELSHLLYMLKMVEDDKKQMLKLI